MTKTFNENAFKFYEEGLVILKEIKAKQDEILLKQDETTCILGQALTQVKLNNIYLESMTDLRLTDDDIT